MKVFQRYTTSLSTKKMYFLMAAILMVLLKCFKTFVSVCQSAVNIWHSDSYDLLRIKNVFSGVKINI